LILRKLAPRQLIATYAEERKASVQQVIDNDTVIATLISGNYPDKYKGRQESTRQLLNEWFESAANQSFTLGLGVAYGGSRRTPAPAVEVIVYASTGQENMINRSTSNAWPLSTIPSGQRGPDARLSRIGTGEQRRLLGVLANDGKFNLVVFAGMPHLTRSSTATLRASLDSKASFLRQSPRAHEVVAFTTLIVGDSIGAAEALDCAPFGRAFFDTYREAHDAYGVDVGKGAMIVLRPDGHLATVFELATAAVELGRYFASFTTLGAL
jgi:phenol 2-monooxygenase